MCDSYDPVANIQASVRYIKDRYSAPGSVQLDYASGGLLPNAGHEFVCTYCERGQCARCNDRGCTCCYGNED